MIKVFAYYLENQYTPVGYWIIDGIDSGLSYHKFKLICEEEESVDFRWNGLESNEESKRYDECGFCTSQIYRKRENAIKTLEKIQRSHPRVKVTKVDKRHYEYILRSRKAYREYLKGNPNHADFLYE